MATIKLYFSIKIFPNCLTRSHALLTSLSKSNFLHFDIKNYSNKDEFFQDLNKNNSLYQSTIVTNSIENFKPNTKNIDMRNILVFENFPIQNILDTDSNSFHLKSIQGKEKTIIFSYLHSALNVRNNSCNKPITLLCCDNIRENGVMLKK